MPYERDFQPKVIRELEERYPGAILLKNDANYLQGFPDITFLYRNFWAVLESKRSPTSSRRPNQPYYIDLLNDMSFARFIHPLNKEQIFYELEQALQSRG